MFQIFKCSGYSCFQSLNARRQNFLLGFKVLNLSLGRRTQEKGPPSAWVEISPCFYLVLLSTNLFIVSILLYKFTRFVLLYYDILISKLNTIYIYGNAIVGKLSLQKKRIIFKISLYNFSLFVSSHLLMKDRPQIKRIIVPGSSIHEYPGIPLLSYGQSNKRKFRISDKLS